MTDRKLITVALPGFDRTHDGDGDPAVFLGCGPVIRARPRGKPRSPS